MTGVLIRRKSLNKDRYIQREDDMKTERECQLHAKVHRRLPEAWNEVWSRFSPIALKRSHSADTCISHF
jgi:hypothetical protein